MRGTEPSDTRNTDQRGPTLESVKAGAKGWENKAVRPEKGSSRHAEFVYHDTNDEKVYEVLSQRMKYRYNLFGSLPDTIEDDWIVDIENLEAQLKQFTERKKQANAFDLRYGSSVQPEGQDWELCERVLARRDVVERLSEGGRKTSRQRWL